MVTVISNEKPAYRILSVYGFFGPDDHLYGEGDMIYFEGEPNEEMEPLNEPARNRLTSYFTKLDTLARQAADKLGRPFIERPKTLEGAVMFATELERASMAVMSAKKDTTEQIQRISDNEVPETGKEKRGRGRPRKEQITGTLAIAS